MRDRTDRELEHLFRLDDGPGPARPADDARSAAIIAGALLGAGFPPPVPTGGGASGPAHGGATKAAATATAKGLAATKLAVLAGGAVAVAVAGWVALRAPAAQVPSAAPVAIAPSGAPPLPAAPPPPPPPPIETAVPIVEPAIDSPPLPEPRTSPPAERATRPRTPSSPAKGAKPAAGSRGRRPPASTVAAATAPEDLLAAANAARAAHRWREADALYARVASGAPAELAQQTALVASASLHLEHLGDPAGALRRFRAALAAGPHDALAEDARWGLAEAARATGNVTAEAAALDDFVVHHASSPRAARARTRRTELGATR
jgi:hypothetical protein